MALYGVKKRRTDKKVAGQHLHNGGHHANIHHDPAKSQSYPVLAEVHRQAVSEQSAGHAANGKPNTVQAQLCMPFIAVATIDPSVEEVAKDPA